MPYLSDVITPLEPTIIYVKGLNRKTEVHDKGLFKWIIVNKNYGNSIGAVAPAYYVPSMDI
eukprot:2503021-Ditylum_brightwellii.AAC.1